MPRRIYLLVTLATLAGAGLRLWQLTAVPPGLHYDLAATALVGNDVAFGGYRPVFISAFTGHEVLFYYWLALWFRLIGSSVFALRLAAATLGILTIPATFFAVRELLRQHEASPILAALASTFLAFAFFHVAFSRFGFRVITQPLIQALALGFLFRGLHRSLALVPGRSPSAWRDFALAGAFTGLAAYTYLAARFFPIPLALFWLSLITGAIVVRSSTEVRRLLRSFGVFSLAALITFAPLAAHFVRHPEDFFNRANQIAPRPGEAALLLHGLRRAAEMIFLDGEPYDRFNLPGLPLLGPVLGVLFVAGLFLTARRLWRPPTWVARPLAIATELLLLAWLPAMLLPTALAVHEIIPSNVRAFGLVPLLFVFPARGLLGSFRWLQARAPGPLIPYAYPVTVLCLIALASGTYLTARNYFVAWANLPQQRLNNDADLTAIAAYLNDQDLTQTSVFVSALHYRHPTLAYLARDFPSIRWLYAGASLALPLDQPALYVFARSAPPPEEWVAEWEAHLVAAPLGPDGAPDFRAYRFEPGQPPPLPAFEPLEANFGHAAALTGYRLQRMEDHLTIDLRWRIENLIEAPDVIPYVRLYDAWGYNWSQSGGFHYPSEQWSPGDTLLTRVSVPVPAGLPPGAYRLKAGLFSEQAQFSLPHLDARGAYAGERAPLGEVTLPGGPAMSLEEFMARTPLATPTLPMEANGALSLLGYNLNTTTVRQGERVQLALYWHAPRRISPDPLVILLAGHPLYIGQPVNNTFPFWDWAPGQLLTDRYVLKVPPDFPPGPAELTVQVKSYGAASLATLEVQPVVRSFNAPAPTARLAAEFGQVMALRGYDLEPGPDLALALYWEALEPMDEDYTVFVHVLDGAQQVVAQADAPPRAGAYPTSLWVPGEFVADGYRFTLPPGAYAVEVGLYLPETGERLPAYDEAGQFLGSAVRLPTIQLP